MSNRNPIASSSDHSSSNRGTRRRVLYLNHGAKRGGGELALWRILGAIDQQKVRPVIVFGEDGPAADLMRNIGVETHILPMDGEVRDIRKDTLHLGALMHLGRVFAIMLYARQVARVAGDQGIDVIHTNTLKAHFYGTLAGWMTGLPVIWHVRDHINASYLPRAAVWLVRLLARWAPKRIVCVSTSVMQELHLQDGQRKAAVVLDGLTEAELKTKFKADSGRASARRMSIGMAGRLARWKGQHVLIEAAAKVIAAGFDVEFRIIGAALFGEESYEAELRQQALSLGLSERVQFCGFKSDVMTELEKLDILVHASITAEPFGQVILEGMAAGLPVIASRGGGVLEIVTHGENGLLTPMGDASALAEAILKLLREPETAQRLGNTAYRHVREKFRADLAARKMEKIYQCLDGEALNPRKHNG